MKRDRRLFGLLAKALKEEVGWQDDKWGWPRDWQDVRRSRSAAALVEAEQIARLELADGEVSWDAILGEECGEQAQAEDDIERVIELVQVAAVALSAAQDLLEKDPRCRNAFARWNLHEGQNQ